jgi:acyl-CoA hydrolase
MFYKKNPKDFTQRITATWLKTWTKKNFFKKQRQRCFCFFLFSYKNQIKMNNNLIPKTIRASQITLAQLMQPEHSNSSGNIHGGSIMKLVDEAGALACMRHSGYRVVTVAIDSMVFSQPINIGNLVTLTAQVTYAGHTSMEAEVNVTAEDPVTGQKTHTNKAYLIYVALDENHDPVQVAPLTADTPEDQARLEAGKKRQVERLARRK